MNMRPGSWSGFGLGRSSLVALVLATTILGGCFDPDPKLDPALFAGDGAWEHLRRVVTPESYWDEKVAGLALEVESIQTRFHVESEKYRQMLASRRAKVAAAVTDAEKRGVDPKPQRHAIIKSFREELDPLRAATRELGKTLRHKMVILSQARQELTEAQK